ncbi:unnamed protein product [Polarella glacialis]|uniref:Uncharacterized protein n=1 Tax=Polarella glacialis TaxID=89957 RepID=A0A813J3T4_POLGL|nr:unnamed protein product [Polarella glacialis]CAE8661883.1 unnamed protein product [Polarella glacialis]
MRWVGTSLVPSVLGGLLETSYRDFKRFASQEMPRRSSHSLIARHAVMDPPTKWSPPDVEDATSSAASPWTQCNVEECDAEGCRLFESWVFRQEHRSDFDAFLGLRNLKPAGFLPGQRASLPEGQTRTATVTCHDRGIDETLTCGECMRLVLGGPYGARGVAVPAYPPQSEVLGCLSKTRALPEYKPQEGDRWDTNQELPRETAFCNSVNARL